MIYFELFLTFLKIGLFTIGGGNAMIPLIMREVTGKGWLSEQQIIDFIAIAESTPGAFAVNIATYTGVETAGIIGAICSTLGVVLPSLIIITIIAKLFMNAMKKPGVRQVFIGVRSSVTGLLLSVLISLFLMILFNISSIWDAPTANVSYIGIGLFFILFGLSYIKIKGKRIPPPILVLISAILGILMFGFIPH